MPSIILASGSPRRKRLLRDMGIRFRVIPGRVPERKRHNETARTFALRMSMEKAQDAARRSKSRRQRWIIGADTVVVIKGHVLGKPGDKKEARKMLRLLQGRTHRVITGITLLRCPGRVPAGTRRWRVGVWAGQTWVQSLVTMKRMTGDEIEAYLETGEPFDKAGAYAIQGKGGYLVRRIQGSYSNVVGLPLCELYELLAKQSPSPPFGKGGK